MHKYRNCILTFPVPRVYWNFNNDPKSHGHIITIVILLKWGLLSGLSGQFPHSSGWNVIHLGQIVCVSPQNVVDPGGALHISGEILGIHHSVIRLLRLFHCNQIRFEFVALWLALLGATPAICFNDKPYYRAFTLICMNIMLIKDSVPSLLWSNTTFSSSSKLLG